MLRNKINISFGLTNARSFWQKTDDLFEYMRELDLALTIVTETWLYDCEALKTLEINALNESGMSFINRLRKKKKRSNPGGGISIVFRKS